MLGVDQDSDLREKLLYFARKRCVLIQEARISRFRAMCRSPFYRFSRKKSLQTTPIFSFFTILTMPYFPNFINLPIFSAFATSQLPFFRTTFPFFTPATMPSNLPLFSLFIFFLLSSSYYRTFSKYTLPFHHFSLPSITLLIVIRASISTWTVRILTSSWFATIQHKSNDTVSTHVYELCDSFAKNSDARATI